MKRILQRCATGLFRPDVKNNSALARHGTGIHLLFLAFIYYYISLYIQIRA